MAVSSMAFEMGKAPASEAMADCVRDGKLKGEER